MSKDTLFIIPCYNEELKNLQTVIHEIHEKGFDVLLVNDGSDIDYQSVKTIGNIKIKENLGQGVALYEGMKWALCKKYKFCVHFDGDGQHRVYDAIRMLDEIKKEYYDIILGSRFLNKETKINPIRKTLLKIGIIINLFLCGIKLTDSNNGLRVLNMNAMAAMDIKAKRMAHASEIVWLIKKNGLKYTEYPVLIKYTEYSQLKGQKLMNSFNVFFEILKVYIYHYWRK